jgi:hypothetical protein
LFRFSTPIGNITGQQQFDLGLRFARINVLESPPRVFVCRELFDGAPVQLYDAYSGKYGCGSTSDIVVALLPFQSWFPNQNVSVGPKHVTGATRKEKLVESGAKLECEVTI